MPIPSDDTVEVVDSTVVVKTQKYVVSLSDLSSDVIKNNTSIKKRLSRSNGSDLLSGEENVENVSDLEVVQTLVDEIVADMSDEERAELETDDTFSVTVETSVSLDKEPVVDGSRSGLVADKLNGTITDPELSRIKMRGEVSAYLERQFGDTLISASDFAAIVSDENNDAGRVLSESNETYFISDAAIELFNQKRFADLETLAQDQDITINMEWLKNADGYLNSRSLNNTASRATLDKSGIPHGAVITVNNGGGSSSGDWWVRHCKLFSKLYYTHAGIFDKNLYNDKKKCMRSATDGKGTVTQSLDSFTDHAIFAIVYPQKYSRSLANEALSYAVSIFKFDSKGDAGDGKVPYYSEDQMWDGYWGDDNDCHNLRGNRAICTKVSYTAWKKAGIGIDSGNKKDSPFSAAGDLIHPDELRNSSKDVTKKVVVWKGYYFGTETRTVQEASTYLYYKKGTSEEF